MMRRWRAQRRQQAEAERAQAWRRGLRASLELAGHMETLIDEPMMQRILTADDVALLSYYRTARAMMPASAELLEDLGRKLLAVEAV